MEPEYAATLPALFKPRPQFLLARRSGKESVGERAQVKPGSAGDDGQLAAPGNIPQRRARLPAVFAGGEGLIRVGNVDKVMRQARPIFGGWLGGPQVHATVDGDRVATHDLAAEALPERKRKRGLAATSGAQEEDGERIVFGEVYLRG